MFGYFKPFSDIRHSSIFRHMSHTNISDIVKRRQSISSYFLLFTYHFQPQNWLLPPLSNFKITSRLLTPIPLQSMSKQTNNPSSTITTNCSSTLFGQTITLQTFTCVWCSYPISPCKNLPKNAQMAKSKIPSFPEETGRWTSNHQTESPLSLQQDRLGHHKTPSRQGHYWATTNPFVPPSSVLVLAKDSDGSAQKIKRSGWPFFRILRRGPIGARIISGFFSTPFPVIPGLYGWGGASTWVALPEWGQSASLRCGGMV